MFPFNRCHHLSVYSILLVFETCICLVHSQYWSDWFNGSYTGSQIDSMPTLSATDASHITKLCSKSRDRIEEIEVWFDNNEDGGPVGHSSSSVEWQCFEVQENECFTYFKLQQGTLLDGMQIVTSTNRSSAFWGKYSGSSYILSGADSNVCISQLQLQVEAKITIDDSYAGFRGIRAYFITITPSPTSVTSPSVEPTQIPTTNLTSNVPYSTSGNSGNTITVSETIMTKTSEDRVDSTTTQISTNYAPSSTSTPLRTSPDIQSTATQYQTQSDDLDEPEVIDNDDKNVAIILISSAVSLVAIIGAIIWYWIQRRKWKKEFKAPPQLPHGVIGIKGGEDDHEMDERKETEIEGKMAEQEIEKESSASESAEKLYEVQKSKDTKTTKKIQTRPLR